MAAAPASPAILVFLHLPRTGGTALHEALSARHAPGEICPARMNRLEEVPAAELARHRLFSGHYRFEHLALVPRPHLAVTLLREPRARVVSLHRHWRRHWPALARDNAGLRLAQAHGLRDFLRLADMEVAEAFDNAMARQLAGDCRARAPGHYTGWAWHDTAPVEDDAIVEAACRNLARLDLVGFAPDALHAALCARMGWPAPAPLPRRNAHDQEAWGVHAVPAEPIAPEAEAELDRVTRLDRRVWEHALARAGGQAVWEP